MCEPFAGMDAVTGPQPAPARRGGVHSIGAVVSELLALYPPDPAEEPRRPPPDAARPRRHLRREPLAAAVVAEV